MNALFCLTALKIKNKLLEILKKPLKLIVVIGFAVLLVMNFSLSGDSFFTERPFAEFKAIVFAFYILCFVSEAKKGFHSGGSMFSMADVNLLFMSPLRSAAILFHGMLSRFGSSVFMALAFVYQFALLRSCYSISVADMLLSIGGYAAVLFLSQLTGMLIYSFTCGDAVRIKKGKIIFYSLCAFFAVLCAVILFTSEYLTLSSLALTLTSLPMRFFPVAGWVFTAVDGFMLDDTLKASFGIAAAILFAALSFTVLAFSKNGFYEDVLLSCEKSGDRKADEGIRVDIKARKTGSLKSGRGASVLFYKHLLENKRTKTSFFSPSTLLYLVLIGVYGFVLNGDFVILFSFSCMVSFVPVLSGRWLRELTTPHVFLIPEPPVKKLFYILPEMLSKLITESVLQCILIGYICDLGPITALLVIIARLSVSFVLVGSALLSARIFREREKNSIFLTLSVLPGIIFTLPSVFFCVACLNFGLGIVLAFAVMATVNIAVSAVLIFASRNILRISA